MLPGPPFKIISKFPPSSPAVGDYSICALHNTFIWGSYVLTSLTQSANFDSPRKLFLFSVKNGKLSTEDPKGFPGDSEYHRIFLKHFNQRRYIITQDSKTKQNAYYEWTRDSTFVRLSRDPFKFEVRAPGQGSFILPLNFRHYSISNDEKAHVFKPLPNHRRADIYTEGHFQSFIFAPARGFELGSKISVFNLKSFKHCIYDADALIHPEYVDSFLIYPNVKHRSLTAIDLSQGYDEPMTYKVNVKETSGFDGNWARNRAKFHVDQTRDWIVVQSVEQGIGNVMVFHLWDLGRSTFGKVDLRVDAESSVFVTSDCIVSRRNRQEGWTVFDFAEKLSVAKE